MPIRLQVSQIRIRRQHMKTNCVDRLASAKLRHCKANSGRHCANRMEGTELKSAAVVSAFITMPGSPVITIPSARHPITVTPVNPTHLHYGKNYAVRPVRECIGAVPKPSARSSNAVSAGHTMPCQLPLHTVGTS